MDVNNQGPAEPRIATSIIPCSLTLDQNAGNAQCNLLPSVV